MISHGDPNAGVLKEIDDAIFDLRASTPQTFEQPLKRLWKLLNTPQLEQLNNSLKERINFEIFLAASEKTGGGMTGSHRLLWPDDRDQQLGLTLVMIERLAADPRWAISFCHTFFYSGRNIISGIHTFTGQVLAPFARDYRTRAQQGSGGAVAQALISSSLMVDANTDSLWNSGANMFDWYLEIRGVISEIRKKSFDALRLLEDGSAENIAAVTKINEYLKSDYSRLKERWQKHFQTPVSGYLGRHIHFGMSNDYRDILTSDLPELESKLDKTLADNGKAKGDLGFEHLLHPVIAEHCYDSFRSGRLRDSVLNAIVAVFDMIRNRTGIDADGPTLVGKALSLTDPYLVLSELDSESGQNDQKGFMQIYCGSYQGVRSPKAHTLTHDLTELKAAQYLVFASLLARRVEEATLTKGKEKPVSRKETIPVVVKNAGRRPSRS